MQLIDALDYRQKVLDLIVVQLAEQNQAAVLVQVDLVFRRAVDDGGECYL